MKLATKLTTIYRLRWLAVLPFAAVAASGQPAPDNAQAAAPVSYASVSQLNSVLSQLEQTSQSTQADLNRLRIEHWKVDGNSKRLAQSNVESIERNLQTALPTVIAELRSSPENINATFRLYRNIDALYDVMMTVVESAGAFGSKDEYQSLGNDFGALENTRHALADRLDALTNAKEEEINRLRTQVRGLQAAVPPPPPKKIIVDDTEPAKKPATKKKTTSKSASKPKPAPASSTSSATPPKQ